MTTSEPGAIKHDEGKLRYDLIPPGPLAELALVYTEGAIKYTPRNWEKGRRWGSIFAAMMRHAWGWWGGQTRHERRMHSLASVAWGAFTLMEYEYTHPELDDRPIRAMSPQPGEAYWIHPCG